MATLIKNKSYILALSFLAFMALSIVAMAEEVVYTKYGLTIIGSEDPKEIQDVRDKLKEMDIYLTPQEREFYFKKCEKYIRDAHWSLDQAEKLCWYLPNRAKRDFTKTTIHVIIQAVAGKDVKSKIVAGCTAVLIDYFDHVVDEWQEINKNLYWAQYYFEMAEWYQDLLFRDSVC